MTGNYTDAWIMLCGSKPCAVLSQSCLTLWDPVDCRPPGFSVHGDSSSKSTRVGCHALFQEKFPTQESNAGLLQCRWLLYHLSHLESPGILEWVAYPFRGSSPPRSQTRVSHTASGILPAELSGKPKIKHQVSSVAQSCLTLCNPMNCTTPGLPVHHQLPEFTQTHVHRVSDAIQLSYPLSSPSPPAPNPSQHQGLF